MLAALSIAATPVFAEDAESLHNTSQGVNHELGVGLSEGTILESDVVIAPLNSGNAIVPQAMFRFEQRDNGKFLWIFDMKSKLQVDFDRDLSLNRPVRAGAAYSFMFGSSLGIDGQLLSQALAGLKLSAAYERRNGIDRGYGLIGPTGEAYWCSDYFNVSKNDIAHYQTLSKSRYCASLNVSIGVGGGYPGKFTIDATSEGSLYYERKITNRSRAFANSFSVGTSVKGETINDGITDWDASGTVMLNATLR